MWVLKHEKDSFTISYFNTGIMRLSNEFIYTYRYSNFKKRRPCGMVSNKCWYVIVVLLTMQQESAKINQKEIGVLCTQISEFDSRNLP
jgi:hypothetical protein